MATSARYLFSSKQRLRARTEFHRVQTKGKSFYSRYFTVILYFESTVLFPRLGIVTGRSYGKASQRSRIRRLVRETFRLHQHNFCSPRDMVVIPKPNTQKLKNNLLRDDLINLWKKADSLKH